MARTTPRIKDGQLYMAARESPLAVGSAAWYTWLADATNRSFAFAHIGGKFTARKEERQRGTAYWIAYRTRAGQLRKTYLGKSEDISLERLIAVARRLDSDSPPSPNRQQDRVAQPSLPDHDILPPVLMTKLRPLPVRPSIVPRERLFTRLNSGMHGKLTLVAAAAGSGKTTLLSAWAATLQSPGDQAATPHTQTNAAQPSRVAWLSLDEHDNDPVHFWTYVITALHTLYPGVGDPVLHALQHPAPPPIESLLTILVNNLASIVTDHDAVLILDDYHTLTCAPIHTALTFLLDYLPPQLHLVIASRHDPPLPLARWRARGELTELRAADLRFTLAEATQFLNGVMWLDLTPDDLVTLEQRTEGWIAGLYLFALALQERANPHDFIAMFTGSNRAIVDYLAEEVLQRQPDDVQQFLLDTSILDTLTVPLCNHLLGYAEQDAVATDGSTSAPAPLRTSQAIFAHLERGNLFLVPLDDSHFCSCYRYHHLFRDFLRTRLDQHTPDRAPTLHHRAASWYVQQGEPAVAIRHALAAHAYAWAADLIEPLVDTMLWVRGEVITLHTWLHAMPADLRVTRPRLAVAFAWTNTFIGNLPAVEAMLPELEAEMAVAQRRGVQMQGEIAAIRARIAMLRLDVEALIAYSQQALELLPLEYTRLRADLTISLGSSYCLTGQSIAARDAFAEACRLSAQTGQMRTAIIANWHLVENARHLGQLQAAAAANQRILRTVGPTATQPLSVLGLVDVGMAYLHYERNDLPTALQAACDGITQVDQRNDIVLPGDLSVFDGIARIEHGGDIEVLLPGYLILARIQHALGNAAEAWHAIEQAAHLNRAYQLAWLSDQVDLTRVIFLLSQGEVEGARHVVEQRGIVVEPHGQRVQVPQDTIDHLSLEAEYLALARVLFALERCATVIDLLEQLLQTARREERIGDVIVLLAFQSVVLVADGQPEPARAALTEALTLAEPEGYVRIFLNEGAPMADLLAQVARDPSPVAAYAVRLRNAFSGADQGQEFQSGIGSEPSVQPGVAPLIEPLSARECDVLHLLVDGRSNQEIADALVIAVSTVRTHLKHIYAKLGVASRMQAAVRARDLGLL